LAIIAELSQDPLWINTLNDGKNLHTVLCAQTFDITEDEVNHIFPYNKDLTYRAVQKTIDFGLAYGMSKFKLSDTIGISEKDAEILIEKFFSKVPKVKQFLTVLGTLGSKRGFIKVPNPYGRVRFFPKFNVIENEQVDSRTKNIWMGEISRASMNTPIQGINANAIKLALVNVQAYIDEHNYPASILLSIYDEIQTECKKEYSQEWKTILEDIMLKSAKVFIKSVPIQADCDIHDCWTK